MMDRQVRNKVVEMLLDVKKGIEYIKASSQAAMLQECIAALQPIAMVCKEHLSNERYAVYSEIFDGMISAIVRSDQEQFTIQELEEVCELCTALLEFTTNALKNEKEIKKEIVFLPYKASMWDSLESIWKAAIEDKAHCNTYVVPIPYCDRNPDQTAREWHCEANLFPKQVPVLDYRVVDLEKMHPDVIFIHYPYDGTNIVTSIDSDYHSVKLKKYTNLLMYVPYYATSGGMGEGQVMCKAYENVDYIVVQAEKICKCFDPSIPAEKLLPLGSPKFDRVVQICAHPPEPPKSWRNQIQGKKVYFYNTSLTGMLEDTKNFLQKMEYVFRCFLDREDVCLIWRPHPLMMATFKSMRPEFLPEYERLRTWFREYSIGIYDDTPDIDQTIALSDVYIGDTGTSVTSLFGIAGKPLFVLNNRIHALPDEYDWRGEFIQGFLPSGQDEWLVTGHNHLYHAADGHHYVHYCDLSRYTSAFYYQTVIPFEGKLYVCPLQARDILVIENHRVVKRIALQYQIEQPGAFAGAYRIGDYIFLLPFRYPAIVRYDLVNDCVDYITGCNEVFVQNVQGEWRMGGNAVWGDKLLLASPQGETILAIDSRSLQVKKIDLMVVNPGGCMVMVADGDEIWLLPYIGSEILCWNPSIGQSRIYDGFPDGFQCRQMPFGYVCEERPFSMAAFNANQVILSPYWGNMFVCLDKKTGQMQEWSSPVPPSTEMPKDYFFTVASGIFVRPMHENVYRFFDAFRRRLYDISLCSKECREVDITLDRTELAQHEAGFSELSEWCRYGCEETAINSLQDLLDGTLKGKPFNRDKQLEVFSEIAANFDGTCGEKIYQFVIQKLVRKGSRK
jgi:hypothetical protein